MATPATRTSVLGLADRWMGMMLMVETGIYVRPAKDVPVKADEIEALMA